MTDIVDQRQRLRQFGVQVQRTRYRAGNLRNFDRMRESVSKMIGKTGAKNLRFRLQPAERT